MNSHAAGPARVDVLIPAYNAASTVEGSVRSIMAQTLTDLRIIVVDDGSTDATPDILARLAREDARLLIVTQRNGGIVDALNAGLAIISAPLIARHDADDLAFPERLARQVAFLDEHASHVAVGCNSAHIDENGRRTGEVTGFVHEVRADAYHVPSIEPYISHPFLMVRRQAIVDVGAYRYCFHSEDTDLYWRLIERGPLGNVTDILGEYRVHANSVTSRSILNGRIGAVSAQLAALSARRRAAGQPDLAFRREALHAYHEARELDAIIAVASRGLSPTEAAYLEIAAVAKLIELCTYRPYRLTREDRRTMRRALTRHYPHLSEFHRRQLLFRHLLSQRRLFHLPRETFALIPWTIMPHATWKAARHRFLRTIGQA